MTGKRAFSNSISIGEWNVYGGEERPSLTKKTTRDHRALLTENVFENEYDIMCMHQRKCLVLHIMSIQTVASAVALPSALSATHVTRLPRSALRSGRSSRWFLVRPPSAAAEWLKVSSSSVPEGGRKEGVKCSQQNLANCFTFTDNQDSIELEYWSRNSPRSSSPLPLHQVTLE